MSYKTMQYRPAKRDRFLKPAFGLAAVFATAATLGLAVVAPAHTAPSDAIVQAHVDTKGKPLVMVPTEVAIMPRTVEVVATRARPERGSSFVPAAYRPRS